MSDDPLLECFDLTNVRQPGSTYSGPVPNKLSILDAIRAEIRAERLINDRYEDKPGLRRALAIIDRHMKDNTP